MLHKYDVRLSHNIHLLFLFQPDTVQHNHLVVLKDQNFLQEDFSLGMAVNGVRNPSFNLGMTVKDECLIPFISFCLKRAFICRRLSVLTCVVDKVPRHCLVVHRSPGVKSYVLSTHLNVSCKPN